MEEEGRREKNNVKETGEGRRERVEGMRENGVER